MKNPLSRRRFAQMATVGAGGLLILRDPLSARAYTANEKLNMALIGCGGRGSRFVQTMTKMANVVAMCDVNEARSAQARKLFPRLQWFYDFRVMLAELGDAIDAVTIAIPDHTHAVAAMAAMRAGKHVLVEKPMSHNIAEARTMRETASMMGVATQMGNQGTASPAYRRAVELIQDGVLGEVREVYVWKDSGGPGRVSPPQGSEPVPSYLKWDLWLGPAARRPYHPAWLRGWHGWRDFGTGQLGNWATHTANLAFRALRFDELWRDRRGPSPRIRVHAEVERINALSFPRWEKIVFQVPARGGLPPVTFKYFNGARGPGAREEIEAKLGRPLDWGDHGKRKWVDHAATVLIGSEGRIWANAHNTEFELMPDSLVESPYSPPQRLPRSPGHEREWLQACRGGAPAWSNFQYAAPLVEFLHLGNVATQLDSEIEYDPVAGRILNNEVANRLLGREYREGWSL